MRKILPLFAAIAAIPASAQWTLQTSNTTSDLRGVQFADKPRITAVTRAFRRRWFVRTAMPLRLSLRFEHLFIEFADPIAREGECSTAFSCRSVDFASSAFDDF